MTTWTPPPLPDAATERFGLIINDLLKWIAGKHVAGTSVGVLWVINRYVRRVRDRFAALAARIKAGKPRIIRKSGVRGGTRAASQPRRMDFPPYDIAPKMVRGRSCLCVMVPQWAAGSGGQLHHLITQYPEMAALVAAAPEEMGRILRPLLRMLGQDIPPILRLPPQVRRPRPLKEKPEPLEDPPNSDPPRKRRGQRWVMPAWRVPTPPPQPSSAAVPAVANPSPSPSAGGGGRRRGWFNIDTSR